jgi:hypothetical protein
MDSMSKTCKSIEKILSSSREIYNAGMEVNILKMIKIFSENLTAIQVRHCHV